MIKGDRALLTAQCLLTQLDSAVVFEKPLKHVQHVLTMCDSRASLTVPEGKKSIFAFNVSTPERKCISGPE
jgi:hypothetical protein